MTTFRKKKKHIYPTVSPLAVNCVWTSGFLRSQCFCLENQREKASSYFSVLPFTYTRSQWLVVTKAEPKARLRNTIQGTHLDEISTSYSLKHFWQLHFNSSSVIPPHLRIKGILQLRKDKQKNSLGIIRLLDTFRIKKMILECSDNFLIFLALLLRKTWFILSLRNF